MLVIFTCWSLLVFIYFDQLDHLEITLLVKFWWAIFTHFSLYHNILQHKNGMTYLNVVFCT